MAKEEIKEWWKSKTLWCGILTALGGILTAVAGEVQAGSAITVIGLVNIVLRTITTTAIK